jgi:hypothetical protein
MSANNEAVTLIGTTIVSEIIPLDVALELMDDIMSTPYATVVEDDLEWLARDVMSTPYATTL